MPIYQYLYIYIYGLSPPHTIPLFIYLYICTHHRDIRTLCIANIRAQLLAKIRTLFFPQYQGSIATHNFRALAIATHMHILPHTCTFCHTLSHTISGLWLLTHTFTLRHTATPMHTWTHIFTYCHAQHQGSSY